MPYNIYDKHGNKIGGVRRPEDEAAAVILTIILTTRQFGEGRGGQKQLTGRPS